MRFKLLTFVFGLTFSVLTMALPPTLHLASDKQRLAHEAARILQEEIKSAKDNNYPLVVVVPTGSTAIPFYQQIVRLFLEDKLDLGGIQLFNMDEYVGQREDDYSESYNAFMEHHLYRFIRDKPKGISSNNLNIPQFVTSIEKAEQSASRYRKSLQTAMHQAGARLIVFGGIGVTPAHIAFNDLTTEPFYNDNNLSVAEKNEAAKKLETRVVALDTKTSITNGVQLTHAITIGFSEMLQADRIIIMANSASKIGALESTFTNSPNYKIPATLLNDSKGSVEFWVSPEAVSTSLLKKSLGIEPATEVASLLEHDLSDLSSVRPDSKKRALFIRHNDAQQWPEYWENSYPNSKHLTSTNINKLSEYLYQEQPPVIVMPLAHDETTKQAQNHIKSICFQNKSQWGETLFVQFDTVDGLLSRYNYWVDLNKEQEDRFETARNQHLSQVRRTAFAEIPKQKSHELLESAKSYLAFPETTIGLEGYFVSDLSNREILNFSPTHYGAKDRLIVIAPHPDDAEIGAAGLIDNFKETPTEIWTMTQGHHIVISVEDVLDSQEMPSDILEYAYQQQKKGQKFIDSANVKSLVRHQESSLAMRYLAQYHQKPAVVRSLGLPFYDNAYQVTLEDENMLMQQIKQLSRASKIVLAVPFSDDEHIAHRVSRELATELFAKWSRENPEKEIVVVAYPTPWTGQYRLYDYNNKGSIPDAIIGAERLQGKGLDGNILWKQLGNQSAQRYQLSTTSSV